MKWLLLGAFGKGALENYYVKGLRRIGIEVTTLDITQEYYQILDHSVINKVWNKIRPSTFFLSTNKKLGEYMAGKHFDVILIFKGLTIFPDTLIELKKKSNLLCCYNPDHPFKFFSEGSGNSNILESIKLYDIYFSYSTQITSELNRRYNVSSYTVPFGYDDTQAGLPISRNNEFFFNHLLFAGSYDKERSDFLYHLSTEKLLIYGDNKWYSRNKKRQSIRKAYQGKPLYDEEYKAAIKESLGVLNLLRKQNTEEGSHNMRTFEVPGYGGLLISNRTLEQMAFFEEDKEAVFFDSIDELNDKLNYLSKYPQEVEKIKMAALRRSNSANYGYTYRSHEMFNIINNYLK